MTQLKFDVDGRWQAVVPKRDRYAEVFALARAFVAHEETLAPAKQCPYLEAVRGLLSQAALLESQRTEGEATRTISAETLKRAEKEAQGIARQVQGLLIGFFPDTPEVAEQWGLNLKQGTGLIQLPDNRDQRLAFLNRYIAQEESRPPAERFPKPVLAEVQRVRDTITTALLGRSSGRTQREGSISSSLTVAHALQDTLKAALVYLISMSFGYKVVPELQAWGFEVVARSAPHVKEEKDQYEATTA